MAVDRHSTGRMISHFDPTEKEITRKLTSTCKKKVRHVENIEQGPTRKQSERTIDVTIPTAC